MLARRALLAPSALVLALMLTGCGDDGDGSGGGTGRPTAEEIAEVLPTDGLSPEQVDCLVDAFVDSEISDEGLRAMVDAGGVSEASGLSDADASAVQDAATEALGCSVASADVPPVTG